MGSALEDCVCFYMEFLVLKAFTALLQLFIEILKTWFLGFFFFPSQENKQAIVWTNSNPQALLLICIQQPSGAFFGYAIHSPVFICNFLFTIWENQM